MLIMNLMRQIIVIIIIPEKEFGNLAMSGYQGANLAVKGELTVNYELDPLKCF